jgi:hypothetical protein
MDISKFKIDTGKMFANGDEYFGLYEKHIPRGLGKDKLVLVYEIQNLDCIIQIISLNPEAGYIIVGNEASNQALKMMLDENIDVQYLNSLELKDCEMKFDCIIMNPPYSKNLHLKILAEAIQHLTNDGTCVNLSPILWVEDPHAHMKQKSNLFKFKTSIIDKCYKLEVINNCLANEQFSIGLYSNLGIYVCKKTAKSIDGLNFWKRNFEDWEVKLFENIYAMKCHLADKCDNDKRDGIRVPIAFIAGNRGTLPIYKDIAYVTDGYNKDGIDWTKCKNNGGYEKKEGIPIPVSIKFNTENEAQNFYDSWKTQFSRWLSRRFLFDQHIQLQFLPWMEDYTKPWDDIRFYKYFNIMPDEQKIIEAMMDK